jgi:hypothetical protein
MKNCTFSSVDHINVLNWSIVWQTMKVPLSYNTNTHNDVYIMSSEIGYQQFLNENLLVLQVEFAFSTKRHFFFEFNGMDSMSQSVLSRASNAILCVIRASSHMFKDAACISLQSMVPHFILHVVLSSKSSQGILKQEWDECLPGKRREATLDDATDKTIFLCPQRYVIIVF